MPRLVQYCALLVCLCAAAAAQDPEEQPEITWSGLRVTQITAGPSQSFLLPFRCDEEGNIYGRVNDVDLKAPVLKLSPKQELLTRFASAGNPELEALESFGQFHVTLEGEVYQLAWDSKGNYIVRFGKDGAFRSRISLSGGFAASHVVAFKGGQFLVAGEETDKETRRSKPFTAVFDRSGRMVKRFSLAEDQDLNEAVERGDNNVVSEHGSLRAVNLGQAVMGSDGNAYVMRRTSPTMIYGISPSGEVVQTFKVEAEAGLLPEGLQSGEGTLAVMFRSHDEPRALFKVLDIGSGTEIASYATERVLGPLACFKAPHTFTILTYHGREQVLLQAEP